MGSPGVVELGFAEAAAAPWRLRSEQFPCKVGGRPAWLGEAGVPGPGELRCGVCGRPCAFLLQLYAPLVERPDAFHRSLFLFACRQPACYRLAGAAAPGCLKVFRNQLPRKNDTYSYDPPPEEPPVEPLPCVNLELKCGAKLCRVCGCLAPKRCSKCHKAHYCSQDHQIRDWKAGHKVSCSQPDTMNGVIPDHKFLFPEYEIVREPEEIDTSNINKTEQENLVKNEATSTAVFFCSKEGQEHFLARRQRFIAGHCSVVSSKPPVFLLHDRDGEQFPSALSSLTNDETSDFLDENFLEAMAKHETQDHKIFQKFKERISLEPEQIIRYCRDGEGPLWISGENIPQETDIPDCSCGAKRIFEFQVMPQLLNHLKVDSLEESIDWGILAIYTCAENCNMSSHYAEDFIWKQDISNSL